VIVALTSAAFRIGSIPSFGMSGSAPKKILAKPNKREVY
jgi:hypothetical protein